ncbi:DUF2690 domain-containing protein [Shimazuella kribbensis]|uniref:DUF2690 domain-containing protein n=1 Tax=Shimazuella kribbensis TaxID=139808 RepID=UPI0014724103|nr:DUF2690 domain-containing protein [Shimazuella kribbensis]
MNKSLNIISIMVLALVFVFSFSISESFAKDYNFTNPYKSGCSKHSKVVHQATVYSYDFKKNKKGKRIGTNFLYYSSSCKTMWSKVVLSKPAPFNKYAQAMISPTKGTFKDGSSGRYCGSPGGNGIIMKGQTSCYTPQVDHKSSRKGSVEIYEHDDVWLGSGGSAYITGETKSY